MLPELYAQINTFFVFVWLIAALRSLLFWLYYLQVKQYRWDRLSQAFKSAEGIKLLASKYHILLLVMLTATIFVDLQGLATGFFAIYAGATIYQSFANKLKMPELTYKALVLLGVALLVNLVVAWFCHFNYQQLIALEIIQPALLLVIFVIFYAANQLLKANLFKKAIAHRAQFKNLIVIGITGSYGKTSTKEFLTTVLAQKYKVLATPKHINVDAGIALFMLKELKTEHEIFIVEMGAYQIGEIKIICDLVKPDYGILTGISDQHLELFGSQANIIQAKFELVEAISDPKKLIANADSELVKQEMEKRALAPTWYSLKDKKLADLDVPVFGRAAQSCAWAALTCASQLGLSPTQIKEGSANLKSVAHTMEIKESAANTVLIDDSYNANTEGVIFAIKDLASFKNKKKILVFKNVPELGENAAADHKKIAQMIDSHCDYAFLLPSANRADMLTVIAADKVVDLEKLKELAAQNSVILFEGREAQAIMQQFL